jgi:hypothetical protein
MPHRSQQAVMEIIILCWVYYYSRTPTLSSLGFLLNRKPDGFFLNESCLELNCGWKKLYPKGIIIGKVLLRIVFIAVIL